MEEFLNQKLEFDDLFDRLMQMQNYLLDIKKLELFNLPKPVCLQNAYMLNMHYINNNWNDTFPRLKTVEEFIQAGKKLFFLPETNYYYYLYYHLLIAYKEFEDSSTEIYDDETALDYDGISHYLLKNNLNATEFFKLYLKGGIYLDKEDIKRLQKANEVTDDKLSGNIHREMSSEPTAPMFESEIDLEVPKIFPSSLEVEVGDLEDYPEERKVATEVE